MIRRRIVVLALALTLLLPVLFTGCGIIEIAPPEASPAPTPTETVPVVPINPAWTPPAVTGNTTAIPAPAGLPNIADVVAAVKPSVVAINITVINVFNQSQEGAGSGWIIDPNGIIVTNNHVIEGANTVSVTMDDGKTYNVEPKDIYTDALNDLAILRINATNLPALKVGDSAKVRVGEWVVAIGNALGQGISATEGIISRKGVTLPVDQGQTLYDLIGTSAAINPGNSGGPLVSMAGEVVGITSAKLASIGIEGMGYAISSNTAMPLIQQLIKNGYVVRPWLGVNLRTVDQFTALAYRLAVKKGAMVSQVAANSPAANGGLQPNDVIVAAGGKDVNTADDMVRIIIGTPLGQTLDVTYYRGTEKKTTQVTPIQSPAPAR